MREVVLDKETAGEMEGDKEVEEGRKEKRDKEVEGGSSRSEGVFNEETEGEMEGKTEGEVEGGIVGGWREGRARKGE